MTQYFKLKKDALAYAKAGKEFGIRYHRILPTSIRKGKNYKVVSARTKKDLMKKLRRMQ